MKNIWVILIAICVVLLQRSYYENKILDTIQNTSDDLLVACEQKIDQLQDTCDDLIADAVEQGKAEVLEMF